jgi:ribosomal protein L16 Arg81 hydroxylase
LKIISTSHHRLNQTYTALGYISLSSESATYGRHNDVMDVWCWQMTGYTLWKVEGHKRNFEKVLEPGELIYVPRGMWHDTKPMTPRAGLSFGAEDSYVR